MSSYPSNFDALKGRIEEIAAGTPYRSEAFMFVLQAVPHQFFASSPSDHLKGAELCWCLRDRAIIEFGPKASETLHGWSVQTCDDFGNIVYMLIDAGLLAKTEKDSKADFHDVYDFDQVFHENARPRKAAARFQWRISTMLWITTLAAIALAGFGKLGFFGAVGTVFSSWIGLIGVVLLAEGLANRSRDWILAVCVGVGLCGIAIAMFVAITFDSSLR
jgi:uncharacterized repeat protein (TIGR04138 family)